MFVDEEKALQYKKMVKRGFRCVGRNSLFDAEIMVGTSAFGGLYVSSSDEDCYEVVQRCLELGWRRFDTAPHYGLGVSEERLGKALNRLWREKRELFRHKPLIYTKVGRVIHERGNFKFEDTGRVDRHSLPGSIFKDAPKDRFAVMDFTGQGILRSMGDSSKRLNFLELEDDDDDSSSQQRDYENEAGYPCIFGLRVHDPEVTRDLEAEAFNYGFAALRTFPGIEISIGTNDIRVAEKALPVVDAILLANRFNLLDQSGSALLREALAKGVPVHLAGVYASGLLAGGNTFAYSTDVPPEKRQKLHQWSKFLEDHYPALSLKMLALAFAFIPQAVTHVVIGLRNLQEVNETNTMLTNLKQYDNTFWLGLFTRANDLNLINPLAFNAIIEPRLNNNAQ